MCYVCIKYKYNAQDFAAQKNARVFNYLRYILSLRESLMNIETIQMGRFNGPRDHPSFAGHLLHLALGKGILASR